MSQYSVPFRSAMVRATKGVFQFPALRFRNPNDTPSLSCSRVTSNSTPKRDPPPQSSDHRGPEPIPTGPRCTTPLAPSVLEVMPELNWMSTTWSVDSVSYTHL